MQTLTAGGTGNGAGQNPHAFHAGIKDPGSRLMKFGQRWYNPTTGTWTQQNTLDNTLDPANANRYAYAGDDPINHADPTGRIDCLGSSILAVGDIAVTAAFIASTGRLALAFATPFALFGVV